MQTDTITLRELTIRYSVKADATGQPVVIGRTLSTPAASVAALAALLQDEPGVVRGAVQALARGYAELLSDPDSAVSTMPAGIGCTGIPRADCSPKERHSPA